MILIHRLYDTIVLYLTFFDVLQASDRRPPLHLSQPRSLSQESPKR